jgi:hypothetical protein
LITSVLPVHPRHAALDLFGVHIQAVNVYLANNSPIPVTVLLFYASLLAEG